MYIEEVETEEDLRYWIKQKRAEGMDHYTILDQAQKYFDDEWIDITKRLLAH